MNAINRQKFLAELAKLLSFMYEEDRQYALGMYERMFDIAEDDEQGLIQHLMSPTRQAVIIARAYDAKARKLSVAAQSKEEDGYEDEEEGTPQFVLAINQIFDDLFPDDAETQEHTDNQVSFFELGIIEEEAAKKPKMPKAAVLLENTQEFPIITDEVVAEQLTVEESTEPAEEDGASEESEQEANPTRPDELPSEVGGLAPAVSEALPERENTAEPEYGENRAGAQAEPHAEGPESADEEPEAETTGASEERPEKKRRSIEDLLGWRRNKKQDSAPPQETAEPVLPDTTADGIPEMPALEIAEEENSPAAEAEYPEEGPVIKKPERRLRDSAIPATGKTAPRVPLLILFLIVAIPVTLALTVLLLVPTLLCLTASVGLIAVGVTLIISAFSGFAVLADIMLLLGGAAVALALGLLLLWTAMWLVCGVMGDLFHSVRELALRWCYKEVPAV